MDPFIIDMRNHLKVVEDNLEVPSPDNGDNALMRDVVGSKSDGHGTETIYANVHDLWEGTHHIQKVYPTLADSIEVVSEEIAWTLGEFAEVVPVNTIKEEFHIHHLCISEADGNDDYELVLYAGEVEIGRVTFTRTDKKDDVEGLPIIVPHSAANTQIQAKLANSAGGRTAKIKLWYHVHS